MRVFHISMRSVGETSRSRFFRSAGACPPRSLRARLMARDRPSPYVKEAFFHSSAGPVKNCNDHRSVGALGCHTRLREGFPRERWSARGMARDRPSPYGEGTAFFFQQREVCHRDSDNRDRRMETPAPSTKTLILKIMKILLQNNEEKNLQNTQEYDIIYP